MRGLLPPRDYNSIVSPRDATRARTVSTFPLRIRYMREFSARIL